MEVANLEEEICNQASDDYHLSQQSLDEETLDDLVCSQALDEVEMQSKMKHLEA